MWTFLFTLATAHALSKTLMESLQLQKPFDVNICHNEEPTPTSQWADGICAQAGSEGSASAMCDFNIASAGWKEGTCADSSDYKVGCAGRYDIVFWIKISECDKCTGGTFQLVPDTAELCPHEDVAVCYHVGASDAPWTQGTCAQAGNADSPSMMCEYNIEKAGYHEGTCASTGLYTVGCVGRYDIVFWIEPVDCMVCINKGFKLLDGTEQLCAKQQSVLSKNQEKKVVVQVREKN